MRIELHEKVAGDVLADMGLIDHGTRLMVRPLSGGVANVVLSARWDGGSAVLKQARDRLRVAADWRFDPARTRIERDCMDYLAGVWPPGSSPTVHAFDAVNGILAMSHAPPGGAVWKDDLLAGRVEPEVGSKFGHLLAVLHRKAADDPTTSATFAEPWPLVQGRIDPYHRTAAARHPSLRAAILAEVERLLATRTTLVLGDCSPKNVIVYPERVFVLDFEVAHWGDPALDVAFLLTHLLLKARRRPRTVAALRACATAFLASYGDGCGACRPSDAAVTAELGCLLLSRVDGKSPVEYITAESDRAAVRRTARMLLLERPEPVATAVARAFELLAPLPGATR